MTADKEIVVLVHGIRDFAYWQVGIRKVLESHAFDVELTNYDRFDLLRFLAPVPWFRDAIIERVWHQIQQVYADHPGKKISFIAHSFGTYTLAEILRRKFNFKAHRIIFCGSVVRYDFPFEQFSGRFTIPLLNEVGTRDIWPGIAHSVSFGYGSAGSYGFRRPKVRDRWHADASHGHFLTPSFCEKYWVPFLDDGTITEGESAPQLPAWWVRVLYIIKLRYVVIATLAMIALFASWSAIGVGPLQEWVTVAEAARSKATIHASRPLPTEVVKTRTAFEEWWRNSGLSTRRKNAPDTVFKALSYNSRVYRMYELLDDLKPNANYWSEECLTHFEQIQHAKYITECLIDRAALYLELSQIQHTQPEKFNLVAEKGDSVMTRAAAIAADDQKPEIYRIASRFYYNLARPGTGILTETWSNNYLFLAVDSSQKAYNLDPKNIKNVTQLSRSVQRMAANEPQSADFAWTTRLRDTQGLMAKTFDAEKEKLRTPHSYIPPANILAVMTMDLARRTWEASQKTSVDAASAIALLTEIAIPTQVRAWALVKGTEWTKDYTFDLNYDLGRMRCAMVRIMDERGDGRADADFNLAVADMVGSTASLSVTQLRGAYMSIESDPTLRGLRADCREKLRAIFRVN
jgi:hypothetical protein